MNNKANKIDNLPKMENKYENQSKKNTNDDLNTITKQNKANGIVDKSPLSVYMWLIVVTFLSLAIVFIMMVSYQLFIVSTKPSGYLESCERRSCDENLSLKCINRICNCTFDKYFASKCIEKKINLERCSKTYECKSINYFACHNSVCSCGDYSYWNGSQCLERKSYNDFCTSDECLIVNNLYCNTYLNACMCNKGLFFNGSECISKLTINEVCFNNTYCDETKGLHCINNKCSCDDICEYFDFSNNTCMPKLDEFVACNNTGVCLPPMICNNTCKCSENEYYSKSNLTCQDKKTYEHHCENDHQCREDMGLTCKKNKCICNETFEYYDIITKKCKLKLDEYEECNITIQCLSPMLCNSTCQCSITEYYSKINFTCQHKKTNELDCESDNQCRQDFGLNCRNNKCLCDDTFEYFDLITNKCTMKLSESMSCTKNTECLSPMTCIGTCQCSSNQYFTNSDLKCNEKKVINDFCDINNQCRLDLGLSCQNNTCQCNSTFVWIVSECKCMPLLSYGEKTCVDNLQCKGNSICNFNPTNNPCNCPMKSISGMCDCERVNGDEYYWNGTACVPAGDIGATCTPYADYMCYQITKGTLRCSAAGKCYCVASDSGLGSNGLCKICQNATGMTQGYFFSELCYSFSLNATKGVTNAQFNCSSYYPGRYGQLGVLSSNDKKSFVNSLIENNRYNTDFMVGFAHGSGLGWHWKNKVKIESGWCSAVNNNWPYHCGQIKSSGCYDSINCFATLNFICEYNAG